MKVIKKISKAIMLLSLLALTFCQNIDKDIIHETPTLLTKSEKVVELMNEVAHKNQVSTKDSTTKSSYVETNPCTGFKYPMTFFARIGDSSSFQPVTINSDIELVDFFKRLNESDQFYIDLPVVLLDVTGEETTITSLEELKGTLQIAINLCWEDQVVINNGETTNDGTGASSDTSGTDSGTTQYEYCDKNNKKVYICHKGKTICVSINAVWGHLNHHSEDKLGKCK